MKRFILFLLLAVPGVSCAGFDQADENPSISQTKDNGRIALAQENGFGVMFLLSDEQFFSDWEKPEVPRMRPVLTTKRMVPACTAVIFAGPGLKDNEIADVTYDAVFRKPDGSTYGQFNGMVGANGKINPAPKVLHLSRDRACIRIEPSDPSGTYSVDIVVTDNIKKQVLKLRRELTVEDYPEPESWQFPQILESARKIAPMNIEGRQFDKYGLAYPIEELDALKVSSLPAVELQKYADIVTNAYPDAVAKSLPESCDSLPFIEMNETAVAGMAFVSIHALNESTRRKAASCLLVAQKEFSKMGR